MSERISEETAKSADRPPARTVPLARGLSIKLLVLTVLFVMIAEVLIFLPSIANFKLRWLEETAGNGGRGLGRARPGGFRRACPGRCRTTC